MTFDEKTVLARFGDNDMEAASLRLRASREAIGLSQEQVGVEIGRKKPAISAMENARSYPSWGIMSYFYKQHRIDFNFLVMGDFRGLPADVSERIFAELEILAAKEAD